MRLPLAADDTAVGAHQSDGTVGREEGGRAEVVTRRRRMVALMMMVVTQSGRLAVVKQQLLITRILWRGCGMRLERTWQQGRTIELCAACCGPVWGRAARRLQRHCPVPTLALETHSNECNKILNILNPFYIYVLLLQPHNIDDWDPSCLNFLRCHNELYCDPVQHSHFGKHIGINLIASAVLKESLSDRPQSGSTPCASAIAMSISGVLQ